MRKVELRKHIRQLKRQFTPQQLEELSLDICSRLLLEPHIQQADPLLLYHSLPGEVDTRMLLDTLKGKNILLPHVVSAEEMELKRYSGPADLRQGAFGIMEPCGASFTDYQQIDVAIVPGMAFDHHGHRLGRGKGYYDRFLSRVPNIYKIGLCFGFQLVEEVPTDENDIQMDLVLSGSGCQQ